jgi:hypothetical protein
MMDLAPGVEFFEDKHEYFFKGKQLSGVTGLISKKLGLKYGEFVSEHAEEGIHVHKAVQRWIETGNAESVHPGVQWLVNYLLQQKRDDIYFSEVLVTDFARYASAVDIVIYHRDYPGNKVISIADIKKGNFKRDYVTWQLSIYKYFIEKYTDFRVVECSCLCLKDKDYYPIFPKLVKEVENLLYA